MNHIHQTISDGDVVIDQNDKQNTDTDTDSKDLESSDASVYQKILEDLKKIVTHRSLTDQESKMFTEALRMVRNYKKNLNPQPVVSAEKLSTIAPDSSALNDQNIDHISESMINASGAPQQTAYVLYDPSPHIKTADTASYTYMMNNIEQIPQTVRDYLRTDVVGRFEEFDRYDHNEPSALIHSTNNRHNNQHNSNNLNVSMTQMISLFENNIKSMNKSMGTIFFNDDYEPHNTASAIKIYNTLFLGNEMLIKFCATTGIDQKEFLRKIRENPVIEQYLSLSLFDNFTKKRFLNNPSQKDSTHESKTAVIKHNRSNGIFMLKETHVPSNTSEHIDEPDFYALREHAKRLDRKTFNTSCPCIICLNVCQIVDARFKSELKQLITDNPYENIFQLESMLFLILESGTLKEYVRYGDYIIKSRLEAVQYIDRVQTSTICSSPEVCHAYFSKIYDQKTQLSVSSKHGTKSVVIQKSNTNKERRFTRLRLEEELSDDDNESYEDVKSFVHKNDNILSWINNNMSKESDRFGISTEILAYIMSGDDKFRTLLQTMCEMLEMSSDPHYQWCEVTTIPVKQNEDMASSDITNFELVAKHDHFVKFYHELIGKQLQNYLITSGYLDTSKPSNDMHQFYSIQSLFHSQNHPLLSGFLNLKNLFTNLNHEFIKFVMTQYGVPKSIHDYIVNFYSKLQIRVLVNGQYTDYFRMSKGVLQNDELSNVLITMCVNYLIQNVNVKFKNKTPTGISSLCSYLLGNVLVYTTDHKILKTVTEHLISMNTILNTGISIDFEKSYILMLREGLEIDGKDKNNINAVTVTVSDLVNQTKELLRVLKETEAVCYVDIHELSTRYEPLIIDQFSTKLIDDFYVVDVEIKKRNLMPTKRAEHRNSVNYPMYKSHNRSFFGPQSIQQKIYDHLMMRIKQKISNLIMGIDKITSLITYLDGVALRYATKWGVEHRSLDNSEKCTIGIKNVIQVLANEQEINFNIAVNHKVADMYKKSFLESDRKSIKSKILLRC